MNKKELKINDKEKNDKNNCFKKVYNTLKTGFEKNPYLSTIISVFLTLAIVLFCYVLVSSRKKDCDNLNEDKVSSEIYSQDNLLLGEIKKEVESNLQSKPSSISSNFSFSVESKDNILKPEGKFVSKQELKSLLLEIQHDLREGEYVKKDFLKNYAEYQKEKLEFEKKDSIISYNQLLTKINKIQTFIINYLPNYSNKLEDIKIKSEVRTIG